MVKVVVIKARRDGLSRDSKSNGKPVLRPKRVLAAVSLIDRVFKDFPKTPNERGHSQEA